MGYDYNSKQAKMKRAANQKRRGERDFQANKDGCGKLAVVGVLMLGVAGYGIVEAIRGIV